MRCPRDGTEMLSARRAGVEIDWCPSCMGVWLDRGELEKICDRAAGLPGFAEPPAAPPSKPPPWNLPLQCPPGGDERGGSDVSDGRVQEDGPRDLPLGEEQEVSPARRKRRRRSFLDDIFDL